MLEVVPVGWNKWRALERLLDHMEVRLGRTLPCRLWVACRGARLEACRAKHSRAHHWAYNACSVSQQNAMPGRPCHLHSTLLSPLPPPNCAIHPLELCHPISI